MHGGAWVCRPSNNAIAAATLSWAVGTADSDFPITNAKTLEPDVVAKANENTATLRLTFGGSTPLVGLVLINVNFPSVTVGLTNNGGMATQNVTVPDPEDDLCVNVFWDLDGVANTSATQWNIPVVGTAPVTIGTIVPVLSWDEFRMRWGQKLVERFPVIEHRTGYQKRLQYRIPVRSRMFSGTPFYAEDRNLLRTVRREARGSITPFVFLPNRHDTDVALVQHAETDHEEQDEFHDGLFPDNTARGVVTMPLTLEEVSSGVALL